jgi:endonuclease YncB( thermonuclease family)
LWSNLGIAMRVVFRYLWLFFLVALLTPASSSDARAATNEIIGAAAVRADGTLRVGRHLIRLYGVYIPTTGQQCRTFLSPVYCGNRAAVALNYRIQGFVVCRAVSRNVDGSLNAFCSVDRTFYSDGEDLGAYLIGRGLALAGPYAPFEYVAIERIAQTRLLGIWNFPADSIRR